MTGRLALLAALAVAARLVDVQLLAGHRIGGGPWPGVTPDLVVLVVAGFALRAGPTAGAIAGLAMGLLVGLVPPGAGPLGLEALAAGAAGSVAGRWCRPGEPSRSVRWALGCVAGAVASAAALVVSLLPPLVAGHRDVGSTVLGIALGAGYGAVGAMVVVPLVQWADRWAEGDRVEVLSG